MKGVVEDKRLSTLDLVLAVMDCPRRSSDFGVILHLRKAPTLEALRRGARSARTLYPASGSKIDGKQWSPIAVPDDGVTTALASPDPAGAVDAFFSRPLDPRKHAPIRQLVVTGDPDGRTMLVTRVHHAAADGSSAAMWLRHQFCVATGRDCPGIGQAPFQPVALRRHSSPVRNSQSAYRGRSQGLWTRSGLPTASRRWLTIELPATRPGADALATAALETLAVWNRAHGAGSRRIGLWLPVNVRQRHMSRFGNGTSRIHVYSRYSAGAPFEEKRREIQRQIRCGLRRGEWAVPRRPVITQLPMWLAAPLLKLYLNRPWVDVGTIPFTYVEDWRASATPERGEPQDAVFEDVERIECIGQLHERHAVAMNGVSHRGRNWMTFTFDPGRLTYGDIRTLADSYLQHVALASRQN